MRLVTPNIGGAQGTPGAPGAPGPEYGGPAEIYQTASRNLSVTKRFSKAHETHYEPWVQDLVAEAPLHLHGRPRVPLPPPEIGLLEMPVGQAIARRHSGRAYGDGALSSEQLATLLTASAGVRATGQLRGAIRRNVTNSGNLGSVELYPVVMRTDGVEPGLYHFDSVHHDLAMVSRGHYASWLRELVLFQSEFAAAAVAVIVTSAFGRLTAKYGPRGYRLALFDVGHVSQNFYLCATALGLAVCATAGFIDEAVNSALGLDGLQAGASLVLLVGTQPAA
jgi:SagB-type dehydrogenase family enzyme